MKTRPAKTRMLAAIVADANGNIFELPDFMAVGASGPEFAVLTEGDSSPLPYGSELMRLPDRFPVVFDPRAGKVVTLAENPYEPGEPVFPVAAFNSPGWLVTRSCACEEASDASALPLFSYGAAGWGKGGFRSAAIQVDRERRQDLRLMDPERVRSGATAAKKRWPENRLRDHLEKCALTYGCPAAKNFFIGRCEAPLPTATACNARCLGCLSLQKGTDIPRCQERIAFTPTPEEIAEITLWHIRKVKQAVVSFGQGCEGDPLLAHRAIEPAVRLIREATDKGTINMNTNAGRPDLLAPILSAGLDAVRVSINSVREDCYDAYFRPVDFCFADVMKSIDAALSAGKFVSLNYLNAPGVTDSPEEFAALTRFLEKRPIHLIQWRNLNFDPNRYAAEMFRASPHGPPMGMANVVKSLKKRFKQLRHGYFNPPKERFR